MIIEAMIRNAQSIIDAYEKHYADKDIKEEYSAGAVVDAGRIDYLRDNVFPKIAAEEWDRICSVPFDQKGMRECKDIKDKYGLSWNELRSLAKFAACIKRIGL